MPAPTSLAMACIAWMPRLLPGPKARPLRAIVGLTRSAMRSERRLTRMPDLSPLPQPPSRAHTSLATNDLARPFQRDRSMPGSGTENGCSGPASGAVRS